MPAVKKTSPHAKCLPLPTITYLGAVQRAASRGKLDHNAALPVGRGPRSRTWTLPAPIGDVVFYGRKIDDINVREVVANAKAVCEADHRCRFVNAYDSLTTNGKPSPGVLLADNIHLAPKGYEL
jgi:hypothetical protein